jgi:hypothetical protein
MVMLLRPDGPARAADNAALGGIGGLDNGTLLGGDGTGAARVTIGVADLALIKQARDATGTLLPDGSDVVAGQLLYFVLFVDNVTQYPAEDLRITDLLDESQFTYVTGSLAQTTVPSGASAAALWAAPWQSLTDGLGAPDDSASMVDTDGSGEADRLTAGAVTGQANATVRIPGQTIWAIRFQVRVN